MTQLARGIIPGRAGPQNPSRAVSARPDLCRPRSAFTLVELLVVIVVIGILAGISLGALNSARETSRVAKTKATIAKIDKIVAAKYESYLTRRLPITTSGLHPRLAAAIRLLALRDLIRMEMPERMRDITQNPIAGATVQTGWPDASYINTYVKNNYTALTRPSLNRAYNKRYNEAASPSTEYESAECLYMIVTVGDSDARSQFSESEVGDVDGDGLPEFLDAWGRPILFLRWAPALTDTELQSPDPATDHDPFDPYNIETASGIVPLAGLRLVPLIYSTGPDGIDGLEPAPDYVFGGSPYCHASGSNIVPNPAGKPLEDGSGNPLGYHFDNIHNHRLEVE